MAFLVLVGLRVVTDRLGLPFDGIEELRLADAVELSGFFAIAHAGYYLAFRLAGIKQRTSRRCALIVISIHLFAHFLELFHFAGGRVNVYPPPEHLFRNWSTAFIATGDAGPSQILRIFLCTTAVVVLARLHHGSMVRAALGNLTLYSIVMLLAHPGRWLFTPVTHRSQFDLISEGVFAFLRGAHFWLILSLVALVASVGLRAWRLVPWVLGCGPVMVVVPLFLPRVEPIVVFLTLLLLIVGRASITVLAGEGNALRSVLEHRAGQEVAIWPAVGAVSAFMAAVSLISVAPWAWILPGAVVASRSVERWLEETVEFDGLLASLVGGAASGAAFLACALLR